METLTFSIEQIPTLQDGTRFKAVPDQWDLGMPVGYGKSIQEAIESLLESWELKYDEQLLNYKWA